MTTLKWGIVSCGRISNDFTLAVKRAGSARHQLIACATRSNLATAKKFAADFNMPKAYGTYAELFADPEVNAVYIGNLNPDHMACALAAIEAGKAVLCEKPLTLSLADSKKVIEAAKAKGVLLMEALWSRFNPVYGRIRELLKSHNPAAVQANFTVAIDTVDRLAKPELGGGAMLDIGIYAVQLATMVFDNKPPLKVMSVGQTNELGVDMASAVSLEFPDGGHAALLIDARTGCPDLCEARIFFRAGNGEYTSARIRAPFWAPDRLELTKVDGTVVTEDYPIFPNAKTDDGLAFQFQNSQALAYEAEAFADAFEQWQSARAIGGPLVIEHPLRSHAHSLIDAEIMDTVMNNAKN